jgi:hypothetical protein
MANILYRFFFGAEKAAMFKPMAERQAGQN